MGQSVDVGAAAGSQPSVDDPARRPLIGLSTFAFIAVVTGTFIYAYPTTLESLQRIMVIIHDVSGDLTLVFGAWYLSVHLKRVWRMRRLLLQRWSGLFAVAVWCLAGGTGIYGQIWPMPSDSPVGLTHMISSIVAVVLGCFHGGYGLRRRFR